MTRTAGRSVTVRFDQPVDWDRLPRQGQLEETFSRVVYEKQREAVDQLRTGQARNPSVLSVMADYRTSRFQPARTSPRRVSTRISSLRSDWPSLCRTCSWCSGRPGPGRPARSARSPGPARSAWTGSAAGPGARYLSHAPGRRQRPHPAACDLLRIRVGHDGKVTAEGQPYLLETQAADLRQRFLNATSRALAAYADLGIAKQWAEELGLLIAAMNTAIAEEAQARSRQSEARRAVGGAAQTRVDALAAQRDQQDTELSRHAAQAERLTQRPLRARARGSWPLLGLLFGLLARRSEQRLARIQEAATLLRADRDSTQDALARADRSSTPSPGMTPHPGRHRHGCPASDRRAEGRDSRWPRPDLPGPGSESGRAGFRCGKERGCGTGTAGLPGVAGQRLPCSRPGPSCWPSGMNAHRAPPTNCTRS